MKNLIENMVLAVGKKSSYAGIIIFAAVLVQLLIDMIYSKQL